MNSVLAPLTGLVLKELNALKLEPVHAMPTMLPTWNKMCRDEGGGVGLAAGWYVIVAGNTGQGKTVACINLTAHAINSGFKVGYLSLEMSEIQLATRLQSIVSGVDIRHLEHGTDYDPEVADRAAATIDTIHKEQGGVVYTNSESLGTLAEVVEAANILVDQGCGVIVVDYLQLAWTGSADTLLRQIIEVSHAMRKLAREHHIIMIGISQFNRSISSQSEKPIVQGLMGGSSLENDTDQVVLIDHTSYKPGPLRSATVDLLLAKNRHGSTGKIPCRWDYRTLRLEEQIDDAPPY